MSAIRSFEWDVAACGVPLEDAHMLGVRYERALQSDSCADWIELYVGTFVTLLRNAHRTRRADSSAARRLLQLLEDDLGVQLFDEAALLRLTRRMCRPLSPRQDVPARQARG